MQVFYGIKKEPEGEAWLALQANKESNRNKAAVAALICLILAIIRFSKYEMSIIGIFLGVAFVTLLVTAIVLQVQVIKCKKEYSDFAKERDWLAIKALKDENDLLSRNASFFKAEMEKAQSESKSLKDLLDQQTRLNESCKDEYNSRLGTLYDRIDTLEKRNSVLLRENDAFKIKKKEIKFEKQVPGVDLEEQDVDVAIETLAIVDVKIDTKIDTVIIRDPEPPLKKRYEYSEAVLKGNYISFDLETTGLSPKSDSIIELSAVRFREFKPVSAYSTLVNPLMGLSRTVSKITGIQDDDLCEAPLIHEIMQSFTDFIGADDMVGHNIRAFDLKFLYRFGFEMDESTRNYYDTLSMARKLVPEGAVNNNKLETLLDYFGITRSSAHRGLTDSVAEGMLFAKLMSLQTKKSLV